MGIWQIWEKVEDCLLSGVDKCLLGEVEEEMREKEES
jgi:hypothetical protein